MANIKDLKKKIKSTKGTLKITTAMKLVSAAKLAKAQQAIQSSRPYAEELESTIKTISALVQNYSHPYLKNSPENKRAALLVISSNKGLCGGYNSQLAKKVRQFIDESDLDFKVYFIGKKVREVVGKDVNEGKFYEFESKNPGFKEIDGVADELATLFKTGEFGHVMVAYNKFISAIAFEPSIKQLLPLSLPKAEKEELAEKFPFDFKYDPAPAVILDTIIPETFKSAIYTSMLDAVAAEHGSRMSSMDNAVTNCKEMVRTQTLKMNKLRQAAITTELIEVVSGAESLKS